MKKNIKTVLCLSILCMSNITLNAMEKRKFKKVEENTKNKRSRVEQSPNATGILDIPVEILYNIAIDIVKSSLNNWNNIFNFKTIEKEFERELANFSLTCKNFKDIVNQEYFIYLKNNLIKERLNYLISKIKNGQDLNQYLSNQVGYYENMPENIDINANKEYLTEYMFKILEEVLLDFKQKTQTLITLIIMGINIDNISNINSINSTNHINNKYIKKLKKDLKIPKILASLLEEGNLYTLSKDQLLNLIRELAIHKFKADYMPIKDVCNPEIFTNYISNLSLDFSSTRKLIESEEFINFFTDLKRDRIFRTKEIINDEYEDERISLWNNELLEAIINHNATGENHNDYSQILEPVIWQLLMIPPKFTNK